MKTAPTHRPPVTRADGTEVRAWTRRTERRSAPSHGHPSPRLFLTVFLVVFLGGLGVPGAQALWSQSATTVATVQTGTWISEGWAMPMDVQVTQVASGTNSRKFSFSWSPKNPEDAHPDTTYLPAASALTVPDSLSTSSMAGRHEAGITLGRGSQWNGNQLRFTLTPVRNGVRAKPTVVTITLNGSSAYTLVQE